MSGPVRGSDGALALMADWLDDLARLANASDNTVNAYRRDVADFLGFQTRHQGGDGPGSAQNLSQT